MTQHRIGVLTGGGDAPGLNGVIKAFVAHATADVSHLDAQHVVERGFHALTSLSGGISSLHWC